MKKLSVMCCYLLALLSLVAVQLKAAVVDDFSSGKIGWSDFTFQAGFGIPEVENGQLKFTQPGAGQPIFSATQKTTSSYELRDGRSIEIRVDVTQTGGKDSFAILSWIPTGNSPATLSGYGLAKSTTDILMTKGVERYFAVDRWPPAGKPDAPSQDITLVLNMTASDGSVTIKGQVLDKANNNAVLWERTVIDTPAADVLVPQGDQPAAPFINQSGYFTLYLYQDFDAAAVEDPYIVVYDNAKAFVMDRTVVDDFNDNIKSGWTDFTFVPGFGLPVETDGQFVFQQITAGTPIFSASQRTTRTFDLQEGERLEFRVDVKDTGGKDSIAVLGFIPTTNSPSSLSGYGLAKSTTDVLMSKGIQRYFTAESWPPANKPEAPSTNITLVVKLEAINGSVHYTGQILDKGNNNAVLWEKTVIDTPNLDVVAPEPEQPWEPFITSGFFTLYLYQDYDAAAPENPYFVKYDNAVTWAPPLPENTAPILKDIVPGEFASFLPANTSISFVVTDDKDIPDANISIVLNGTTYKTTNGLTLSGTARNRIVTLSNELQPNVNYSAILSVTDSEGVPSSQLLFFDTFAKEHFVIEAEDYNFSSGSFLDNPTLTVEDPGWFDPIEGSYRNQIGTQGIDFNETRTTPRTEDAPYRRTDAVRMARTLDEARDKYTAAGGTEAGIYDYDIIDIAAGEWLNYTRTFPAGSYEVYLRESVVNIPLAETVLEKVTSEATGEQQTVAVLGSFLGAKSGYKYRTVPLTDGTGANRVIVRLSGETTLRLRQVTPDPESTGLRQNYLMFVPVADPGVQRAAIASISPAPNTEVINLNPVIRVELQNRDTTVNTNSIVLQVNGQSVTPTVVPNENGAVITYTMPRPASGSSNTAKLTFRDNLGVEISSEWSFVVTYLSLNPAHRVNGTGNERGFNVRLVQSPSENGSLANSLPRAEEQLSSNSTIPEFVDTNAVYQVINFQQDGVSGRYFPDDVMPPGLEPEVNGTDNFAVEITGYLELPAGVQTFGVMSDDGFKVTSGPNFSEVGGVVLGFRSGSTADDTFEFLVPEAGLYPFRMVWYERSGDAHAEFFSVNRTTGEKTLINDPGNSAAIKAYLTVNAVTERPSLNVSRNGDQITVTWTNGGTLQWSDRVDGGYTPVPNAGNGTFTTTSTGNARFFRVVR